MIHASAPTACDVSGYCLLLNACEQKTEYDLLQRKLEDVNK